jgi:hypothetical protein
MRGLSKILRFKFTITCLAFVGFLLLPCQLQAERGVEIKSKDDLSHKSGKLGAYRALVIGINDYQDKKIPALKTAVNDAKEFANLLQTRYGFQVTLLLDRQATKQAIMDRMRDLATNASPDESVLIYYAGHGDVDRVLNDGWWVPADAIGGNHVTYLDNNYVQRVMRGMKARHVLLVSDSCYSGTLFGESRSLPPLIDDRYYLNLYNEKSRWGMTSGNKTPVSDSGSEGHSIFAYQLIKALTKNEKSYITTQELYSQIAPIIANNSEQQPLCSPVRDTGDQGGGFVFVAALKESASSKEFKSEAVRDPSYINIDPDYYNGWQYGYKEYPNGTKRRVFFDNTSALESSKGSIGNEYLIGSTHVAPIENVMARDWSSYSGIEFYVKSDHDEVLRFCIFDSNKKDDPTLDEWQASYSAGTDWKKIRIHFNNMSLNRKTKGDRVLSLGLVEIFKFYASPNFTKPGTTGTFWISEIKLFR